MKRVLLGFATAVILGSTSGVLAADRALFDVCVDPSTAVFVPSDAPPGPVPGLPPPGSLLTAAGIIVPAGTIPEGGTLADCSDVADARIGTFFVRGNIVLGLPAAAADDLAYVSWQFRVDNRGTIETTGPVKLTSPYFQPIAGATGSYKQFHFRDLRTDVLDASGFQIRLTPVH